jgi:hypothetical protein
MCSMSATTSKHDNTHSAQYHADYIFTFPTKQMDTFLE